MEVSSVAVHRIKMIVDEPSEEDDKNFTADDDYKELDWMKESNITLKNVTMRYNEDGPAALSNLSIDIKSGERVGSQLLLYKRAISLIGKISSCWSKWQRKIKLAGSLIQTVRDREWKHLYWTSGHQESSQADFTPWLDLDFTRSHVALLLVARGMRMPDCGNKTECETRAES